LDRLRLPVLELKLSRLGLFGGARPRVAWAGVAENPALLHLQAKVETAARQAGAVIPQHRFVPHVTLGRFVGGHQPVEQVTAIERAIVALADFYAGPFTVREFSLFASHAGPKGSRYETLASYELETPPQT
jgi:2'-5' RNA ligase